ncbi:hypothetical protein [Litoribacillus peritrichatus]|uniref:Uncharacterized protein n=1 Tax=Litoribacillus peritrichatus TaxID=718191 RepID=A0ABP7MUD0_9GAMM
MVLTEKQVVSYVLEFGADMKVLKYKGYSGSVEISSEDNCFFGQVLSVEPLINYEGETEAELSLAFEEAVDDYLADGKAAKQ